jgi:hypothetical protein
VVGLATDQAAKVENNALSFVTLSDNGDVGMLKSRELLLVPLPFTLKFLSNFLLEDKSLKSIVTLFLSSRETSRKTSSVILLLIDETCEASILTLVVLDLDLEILGLFGELFSESLEFEEL